MEKRIRLTQRTASKRRLADSATPETAIDLGKNRTYHKIDEYHTFEQTVNHELPDMRHEWKDNPRTETGHGIPKMAKVYMAAKKATKLAMMFLGEDAKEADIEKQARAFMRMGDKALTASINRWAEVNDKQEEKAPAEAPAQEKACKAGTEAPAQEKACKAGTEAPAEAPAQEKACKAGTGETVCQGGDCETAGDDAEAAPAVQIKNEQGDIEIPEADGDDEISFEDEESAAPSAEEEDELAKAFDDDSTTEVEAPAAPTGKEASHKVGVKKIVGQPTLTRIAKKADELSGLWDKWENPDVR